MAREPWLKPRSPSHLYKVGVGGLEPPTSASQTRRASRLRYTPADKSIIRSMLKRQDLEKTGLFFQKMTLVAIALLLLTSACQPVPTQLSSATPTRSNTATIEPPSPSETPTLTATPLPTASITPTKTEDCLSMGGKLQTKSLASEILGNDLDFYVYLPLLLSI